VGDNTKIAVCSLISHGLIFACVFLAPFFPNAVPARESHPGVSPILARSQIRDKLSRGWFWHCFANRHIPFGRSCTFQAAESYDKYILAKKHDHSRISKRMEKTLKKQEFPRLWTSCVIIEEMR